MSKLLMFPNAQPTPIAIPADAVEDIRVDTAFRRVIEPKVNLEDIALASNSEEMQAAFTYEHTIVGIFEVIVTKRATGRGKKAEGAEVVLASEVRQLWTDTNAMFDLAFLKGIRKLNSKRVDKVTAYCTRIAELVNRIERAKTVVPTPAAESEEDGDGKTILSLVQKEASESSATVEVLQKKIDIAYTKLVGLIAQNVEIAESKDKVEGIRKWSPQEEQVIAAVAQTAAKEIFTAAVAS